MKFIIKFKKSIISLSIILITIAIGCSLMAFNGRVVNVDYNNPNFCYSMKELLENENSSAYDNTKILASYNGAFNEIKYIINGADWSHSSANGKFYNIAFSVPKNEEMTSLKVYYMVNSDNKRLDKFIPEIVIKVVDDVLHVNMITYLMESLYNPNADELDINIYFNVI